MRSLVHTRIHLARLQVMHSCSKLSGSDQTVYFEKNWQIRTFILLRNKVKMAKVYSFELKKKKKISQILVVVSLFYTRKIFFMVECCWWVEESHSLRNKVALYLLSDGSRVNRLWLGGCCLTVSLGSVQTSHFSDVTDAQANDVHHPFIVFSLKPVFFNHIFFIAEVIIAPPQLYSVCRGILNLIYIREWKW